MLPSRAGLTSRVLALLALTAIVASLAAYASTYDDGFRYDDFHTVRPWTAMELRQVLHGSWDPTEIEVPFYRPVTAWWYALRFELFGLNAAAHHAVNIGGLILCAFLAGLFVWRETGGARAGIVATGLYAIHPALVYTQGAWITNQMHLLASVTVLLALLFWQRARVGSIAAWWPVFALQILAFGIKEDTVVLLPLLLTLTVLRRWLIRDVPWPAWPVVAGTVALGVGLPAVRYQLLGTLGGYTKVPRFEKGWENLWSGFLGVLRSVPAKRPWQPVASVFSHTVLVGGGLLSFLRGTHAYGFLVGLLIAFFFNLPFYLVTKAEQYHLVALGAVIALVAGIESILRIVPPNAPRLVAGTLALAGAATFLPVTRNIAGDFAPCAPATLYGDALAADWWVVPPEIQTWLRAKPQACKEGNLVSLPAALSTATFAFGVERDETGRPYQWTSRHASILVNLRQREMFFEVRRPNASAASPVVVTVRGPVSTFTSELKTADWQLLTVRLAPTWRARLQGMQRVDLEISPTFVPEVLDPVNTLRHNLGVQLRLNYK